MSEHEYCRAGVVPLTFTEVQASVFVERLRIINHSISVVGPFTEVQASVFVERT